MDFQLIILINTIWKLAKHKVFVQSVRTTENQKTKKINVLHMIGKEV
jgi:uncharacterized membrane protein